MKLKHVVVTTTLVFGAGLLAGRALFAVSALSEAAVKVVFENPRVAVREITIPVSGIRPARLRDTDEVVFFCQESHYQAVNADGSKEPRDRKPGTVVFHTKGEQAPNLINHGKAPVKYFSMSLK